jgi:glycosyltransferase involved in cell wall biosynthesis
LLQQNSQQLQGQLEQSKNSLEKGIIELTLTLSERIKRAKKNKGLITKSGLFDSEWYSNEYLNNSTIDENPLKHYLRIGIYIGHDPNPLFNVNYYTQQNPDVARSHENPVLHYIKFGWKERRDPHPLFKTTWYLQKNPDVEALNIDPLRHYLKTGWLEGRNPNELFDVKWHLTNNPQIDDAKCEPLSYLITHRANEEIITSFNIDSLISDCRYNQKSNCHIQQEKKDSVPAIGHRKISPTQKNTSTNTKQTYRQIDVLVVAKNVRLASAIWRSGFLVESLQNNQFKCTIRNEKEALNLIPNTSIVILQKFTGLDTNLEKLLSKAKEYNVTVWGDMDDLFHPEYIHHSGQALSGLWDRSQQLAIANGFSSVIEELDGLLVSTEKLKAAYKKNYPKKDIFIRRNTLPRRYTVTDASSRLQTKGLNIIYPSGSMSHKMDLEPICEQIYNFLNSYEDCTLTLLGGDSVQVPKKLLERANVRLLPRIDFGDMLEEISRHDLMLVPLLKNPFNDAKSNIKFIEAAAAGIPILTTSVFEFNRCIKDGVNGFIEDNYDNWYGILSKLRKDSTLLNDVSAAAHEYVLNNLTCDRIEEELTDAIRSKCQSSIDERYISKKHSKYPNWLNANNKHITSVSKPDILSRINSYIKFKASGRKAKYVVYTCLSGDYDSLKIPEYLDNEVDYVCYSDCPKDGYGIWDVRSYLPAINDDTRLSRHPKILPHLYLKGYETSLYIDANVLPIVSLIPLIKKFERSEKIVAGIKHPWRNCIYDEGNACIKSNKDSKEKIKEALSFYKSQGYPKKYGLNENNFIMRRHNHPNVIKTMEIWWDVYSKYSRRDQLSFNFALFLSKMEVAEILLGEGKHIRNVAEFFYFSHQEEDIWVNPLAK